MKDYKVDAYRNIEGCNVTESSGLDASLFLPKILVDQVFNTLKNQKLKYTAPRKLKFLL